MFEYPWSNRGRDTGEVEKKHLHRMFQVPQLYFYCTLDVFCTKSKRHSASILAAAVPHKVLLWQTKNKNAFPMSFFLDDEKNIVRSVVVAVYLSVMRALKPAKKKHQKQNPT